MRELESPRANGTLCRDLLFPDIHSPGGLCPGGGAKKKNSLASTPDFFFFGAHLHIFVCIVHIYVCICRLAQEAPGGGGGRQKQKNSLASTPELFVFWRNPPRPAGRHSWSHTLRPCPLSSTPRTSCESLVHLDLCSISQTNLKSFQTGKRRNFK